MTDLYAVLGVPRDADRAAIRRAYRIKARRTHPDAGGTLEDFRLLQIAYDTLIDPTRRRRYDQTGELGGTTNDNSRNELLKMLEVGLDLALLRLDTRGQQPRQADMVRLICDALRDRSREWATLRDRIEKAAGRARELLGRFSDDSEDNLLEIVVARRLAKCQTEIEGLNAKIKAIDEALDVLSRTTFQTDQQIQLSPDPRYAAIAKLIQLHG